MIELTYMTSVGLAFHTVCHTPCEWMLLSILSTLGAASEECTEATVEEKKRWCPESSR